MKMVTIRPDETHLGDLWEAYQDMHLRTLADRSLLKDAAFVARMERAHRRYMAAFDRWAA